MSRKNNYFKQSAYRNNKTYGDYLARLCGIALARFKWEGLPDTVNARFFEEKLLFNGSVAFFREADADAYLCTPFAYNGRLNVYNEPSSIRAYSTGFSEVIESSDDFTIIYNNMLRSSTYSALVSYAKRLYNAERIIDININSQKSGVVILCDEKQRLTFENLYMNYDGNKPITFGSKGLDLDSIKAIPTPVPFVADKLNKLKNDIWNEALTFLGVANVSFEKQSRLTSDEVTFMQGGSLISRSDWITPRQMAAEEINRKFGLNVSVDWAVNDNVAEPVENVDNSVDNSGGEEDE